MITLITWGIVTFLALLLSIIATMEALRPRPIVITIGLTLLYLGIDFFGNTLKTEYFF